MGRNSVEATGSIIERQNEELKNVVKLQYPEGENTLLCAKVFSLPGKIKKPR
jgi:hypothetical protein